MRNHTPYTRDDFAHSPLLVFYEVTRACDLKCLHCRAEAQYLPHPLELRKNSAKSLIDQLATFPKPPLLVLTGGDPLKRPDVFELIAHARHLGLSVAMTPSATPLVTREAIDRLAEAGLHRLAVSLDGADAQTHDAFRQVNGSFARTFEIIADARAAGLPVQINTTVTRHNLTQLDAIADLLTPQQIELWSVFFLVPTGRATDDQRISAVEVERVFKTLYDQQKKQPYAIKTTEAPHYRRFIMQESKRRGAAGHEGGHGKDSTGGPPVPRQIGTNDGKGIMFISHTGQIYPSGFLPTLCGKFPKDSVVDVYQNHPLFNQLRDPDLLGGKCGVCEFRTVCGGSRARSLAVRGDALAEEPDCVYVPPKWTAKKKAILQPA